MENLLKTNGFNFNNQTNSWELIQGKSYLTFQQNKQPGSWRVTSGCEGLGWKYDFNIHTLNQATNIISDFNSGHRENLANGCDSWND